LLSPPQLLSSKKPPYYRHERHHPQGISSHTGIMHSINSKEKTGILRVFFSNLIYREIKHSKCHLSTGAGRSQVAASMSNPDDISLTFMHSLLGFKGNIGFKSAYTPLEASQSSDVQQKNHYSQLIDRTGRLIRLVDVYQLVNVE
jgi:hypothetical protein